MIKVQDLHFHYPGNSEQSILRGVSFSLKKGEKVAVMGANGSGKTTLARCLNGLLQPTSGQVTVDGLSTDSQKSLYEIRRRIGMVFQNPDNQIVATSVEREIAFGLENLGIPSETIRTKVEEALVRFEIIPYRYHSPHLLSGGERQKLALASVWAMAPDYYVLDEPTSLLDPQGRQEVLTFLDSECKAGKGILFVTQYPDESMTFDRLIMLDHGRIVRQDTPSHVFVDHELIDSLGLGMPVEVVLRQWVESLV